MEEKMKLLLLMMMKFQDFYISYVYKNTAVVDIAEDATQIVYDIVILDIGLKGELNGIDVLKEIRKLPEYDKIPIITFTAFAMAGDREKFLSEGFDDYIAKPIIKEDLFALVAKNLQKYKELKQ